MLSTLTVRGAGPDAAIARSALGCMNVVLALALLLAVLLSLVLEVTFAVLTAELPLAVATILIVALAPEASEPMLHMTVDVPEQEPWLVLAETKPTGKVSVTTTLDAEFGPLFTTCMV